jgi:ketosteroid isomerase-like protein
MAIIRINQVSLITAFVLVLFAPTFAQRSASRNSAEQEIKKLESARLAAYLKLDAAALDRLMTDDYKSVYANGEIVTKSTEIDGIKAASAGTLSSFSANIDQLAVRTYEKIAILTGRLRIKGKVVWSEKDIDLDSSFRYTAVYVKTQNSWRITFSQFTGIDSSAEK